MILEEMRALIGAAPPGMEWLEYLFCGFFALFLVGSGISFISAFFYRQGG